MGPHLSDELKQAVKRISFNIELRAGERFYDRRQFIDVVWPDVAAVRPGMHSYALRTRAKSDFGSPEDTGNSIRPGVSDERDLVEVDAEVGHESNGSVVLTTPEDP